SAPEARAFLLRALDDPDPYLRAAAARAAPDVAELRPALLRATRDSEVRVREASVLRSGELGLAAAVPDLRERLQRDAWPLVRVAAAQALSRYRDVPDLDGVLAAALSDPAPSVRAASVRALGRRGASGSVALILERFKDPAEAAPVRAGAAEALGELCATSALEPLSAALQRMLGERPAADDLLVGTAAISALGRLHPPDLEQRFAPLLGKESPPVLRHLALVAGVARPHCASGKVVVPSSASSEREQR
ncbi:MAG TPA: HEAT repeat domain-containing protein, partial [Polyangiaceae bacterium]|nr:HEAT repeat domain-containing protein [Polyangiaceae bacterium]